MPIRSADASFRARAAPLALAAASQEAGLSLTFDAEEADRLELTLDIFERVAKAPALSGWNGLGLAVQAYQKRALPTIDWLAALARESARRIPVRLVKGAYWDNEIKHCQERGLADYPVFTRKAATDVSYLACAKALLAEPALFYPQFATHNAHTLAAVLTLAGDVRDFEFQRLHGMGEALYDAAMGDASLGIACRIYAPVGGHEDLLAYLVRRLLENGANTSFVNRLGDDRAPVSLSSPTRWTRSRAPSPGAIRAFRRRPRFSAASGAMRWALRSTTATRSPHFATRWMHALVRHPPVPRRS